VSFTGGKEFPVIGDVGRLELNSDALICCDSAVRNRLVYFYFFHIKLLFQNKG
jgi:hypothetical protein